MIWNNEQLYLIEDRRFEIQAEEQKHTLRDSNDTIFYDLYCGDILRGIFIQADIITTCILRVGGQITVNLYPHRDDHIENRWFAEVSSSFVGLPIMFLRSCCFDGLVTLEIGGENIQPIGVYTLCSDIRQEHRSHIGNTLFPSLTKLAVIDPAGNQLTIWATL